jgi:hypothetical protein
MGAYGKTVNFTQFQIDTENGKEPDEHFVSQCLKDFSFTGFTSDMDEQTSGWVELDDYSETGFNRVKRDHLFAFAYRKDVRKIPASIMRMHVGKKEREFLRQNPTYSRVPKAQKEQIRDDIRSVLLPRALPNAAVIDVLWDQRTNILTAYSTSLSHLDDLAAWFRETFKDSLTISMIHPAARGLSLMQGHEGLPKFKNMLSGDTVSTMISENTWIGEEFLQWLFARTIGKGTDFITCTEGPYPQGESFSAYIDNKVILSGESNTGKQKVSITGPQDIFSEVLEALRTGKDIEEATIFFEIHEDMWRMTLKGNTFQFASVKIPAIKIDSERPDDERDSLLFECSETLRAGVQLFDSLFAQFLKIRTGDQWIFERQEFLKKIAA